MGGLFLAGSLVGLGRAFSRTRLPVFPAEVGLVFGTGLPWKARARWEQAARLYHQGVVQNLILSGGVKVPGLDICEARWFQQNLVTLGVPPDRMFLEERATNTAENLSFALPIIQAQGFRTVVLIMSDFEGLRVYLTARREWLGQGLEIYECHAPSRGHWSPWTWWLTSEGWNLTLYAVRRIWRYGLLRYL